MKTPTAAVIFPLLIVMTACSSTPSAPSDVEGRGNPRGDFADYRTYNYLQPLSADAGLSNPLIQAADREMQNRGYIRSDEPDLLLNFFVQTDKRLDTRSTPTTRGSFFAFRRGRYAGWPGYGTQMHRHGRGTLVLDMISSDPVMLVWEGVTDGALDGDAATPEVDAAVGAIFARFPYTVN